MNSLKPLQFDYQAHMFAPEGEIDQFFQSQQLSNNTQNYLFAPDSVSTRGTPTPRTVTTNTTAENSPRYSEGVETVSSFDEQIFFQGADEEFQMLLQNVAENVAEIVLCPEEKNQAKTNPFTDSCQKLSVPTTSFTTSVVGGLDFDGLKLSSSQDFTDVSFFQQSPRQTNDSSPFFEGLSNSPVPIQARPEWQKLCIQHSVCIHNIYGNCAYGSNCYYFHMDNFHKPDLLFKTELCRYGTECANRSRCCFAHTKKERRTPEQNVREALSKIRFPIAPLHQSAIGMAPLGIHQPPPGPTHSFSPHMATQSVVRHHSVSVPIRPMRVALPHQQPPPQPQPYPLPAHLQSLNNISSIMGEAGALPHIFPQFQFRFPFQ